jgi:NDP-sugar pyrophosphorylase family protein
MAVGYHAELIMALMGNGSKWGLQIDYSMESEPLGTIGPLREIESLHEPFLVMNGDLLCDIDYRQLMETHRSNGCIATVATCKQHVQLQLGVLRYDEQCRLTGFEEKPAFDYDVSMGIYVFDPRVCEYIPKQGPFGFDQLIHALLKAGEPVAVYPFDGHWLDIGTHEDLDNALREFEANRERYLPDD